MTGAARRVCIEGGDVFSCCEEHAIHRREGGRERERERERERHFRVKMAAARLPFLYRVRVREHREHMVTL